MKRIIFLSRDWFITASNHLEGLPLSICRRWTREVVGWATAFSLLLLLAITTPYARGDVPLVTLWSFTGEYSIGDGAYPVAWINPLRATNPFYGYTTAAGDYGYGTVFTVKTNGSFHISYSLTEPFRREGWWLVLGTDGNYYGTTPSCGVNCHGSVYKIATNGVQTYLFTFNGTNGDNPCPDLIQATDGKLYGTTQFGGIGYGTDSGYGTIFSSTTGGTLATLKYFNYTNGAYPCAGLVQGADGNFYGTTAGGGTNGAGTTFRMTPSCGFLSRRTFSFSLSSAMVTSSFSK